MTERTIPAIQLYRGRPSVDGLRVDDIVRSVEYGRRFRVLQTDYWVLTVHWPEGNRTARGPYARLQAVDDPAVIVVWPRAWYATTGQQMEMFT